MWRRCASWDRKNRVQHTDINESQLQASYLADGRYENKYLLYILNNVIEEFLPFAICHLLFAICYLPFAICHLVISYGHAGVQPTLIST